MGGYGDYQDELHRAIGAVSRASAELDDQMRFILAQMVGSEQGMFFIQGQSSDSLRQSLREQIKESNPRRDPYPHDLKVEFIKHLDSIGILNNHRVWVVHGVFLREDWAEAAVIERAQERPFGDVADGTQIYLCQRSKQRKISMEVRWLSIGDMERIADELFNVNLSLSSTWYAIMRARLLVSGKEDEERSSAR